MTWSVRNRLALLSAFLFVGAAAGCGDNTPKGTGQGGSGGNGTGTAGTAGTDAGRDGDASATDGDANTTDGDANQSDGDANAADGDANRSDGDARGDALEAGGDVKIDGSPDTGETSGAAGSAGTDGGAGTGAAGTDGGAGTGAAGTDGGAGTGAAGTDGGAGTGAAGTGAAGTGAAGTGAAGTGAAGTGAAGTGAAGTGAAGTGAAGTGAAGTGAAGTGAAGTGAAGTGAAGTGAAGTGAAGTGAAGADGGMDASADLPVEMAPEVPPPPACYSVTFTKPLDQAQLTAVDDKSGDQCVDGFQYDVVINTTAPNGTATQLFGGASLLATASAIGGSVTFSGVQFASSGSTNLSIQFPSTTTCTDATTKAKVTVDCSVPTCSVSKPVISATHPQLNGVSTTLGGDRASSGGSPYQVSFEVTTNIGNNQTVALDIDNASTPAVIATVTARATAGKATFVGVPLPTDGTYEVQARCIDNTGDVGRSGKGSYVVDTLAPDLTVSKPAPGAFIGPTSIDINGNFQVCGSTTSGDAVNLEATLGSRQSNFCVSTTGSPVCVKALTAGVDTCVPMPCPGDAPFGITVTISDRAGNPQTTVLSGITCSSLTPTVQIVTPVSDAPTFTDPSKHLLAANAAQTFRDENGGAPGAQTDIIACTSRSGTASLFAGHTGDATLVQVGGSVATTAATAGDNCPSGLGFVAKFLGATLPESLETATGALATATQLRVDVTDVSASTGTATMNLWVDSRPPTLALSSPVNLCGSFQQAFATFDTSLTYTTDTPLVTATITNGSIVDTLSSPTFTGGMATFTAVSMSVGLNSLATVAKDPAGNATAIPPPCDITVGMAPVVIFQTPTSSNVLCALGSVAPNCIDDTNGASTGWQGSLTVLALVGGLPITTGNITFSTGNTVLGSAPLDSTGHATLPNVTLFDGDVTISAQTDNLPTNGVGIGQVTVIVDLGVPDAPTSLTTELIDRRKTSVKLHWNAPADFGGTAIAGYEVRYAKVAIDSTNFDNTAVTTSVPYTGTPSAPTTADSILVDTLYIENGYYFAVEAVDAAGNRSLPVSTSSEFRVKFMTTTLGGTSGLANEEAGFTMDGTADINGDGFSDLAAGAFNSGRVYLFFGTNTATHDYPGGAPSVVITGTVSSFGRGVAYVGNIDGEDSPGVSFEDLAIGDPTRNEVFIYKGRAVWPATLTEADASYVITTNATTAYAAAGFGTTITRIGDFNNDGFDDFVVGAPNFGSPTFVGRVAIILGGATFSNLSLPNTARSIIIDGDAALTRPFFGTHTAGLGHFYASGGTTIAVSAPGIVGIPSNSEGNIYAFRGQSGAAGVINIAAADAKVAGPMPNMRIGSALMNLGPIVGSLPNVGAGNLNDSTMAGLSGSDFVFSGDTTTGPFASKKIFGLSGGGNTGIAILGGAISGRDLIFSLIGATGVLAKPDLVVLARTSSVIDIIDGSKIAGLTSPYNANDGDVQIALPMGWSLTAPSATLIPDINNDTYPDFAISNATSAVPGTMLVYW